MKRLVLILLALPTLSYAQSTESDEVDPESGRRIIYQKATEVDFEILSVDGELVKPTGSIVVERKQAVFPSLVKLRSDFNIEMNASLDDVK